MEVIGQLDYDIQDTRERLSLVNKVLEGDVDEFLVDYYDNYFNVNLSQDGSLSDSDKVSRQLEILSNYLIFQHEKEEKEEIQRLKKENEKERKEYEVQNQIIRNSRDKRNKQRESLQGNTFTLESLKVSEETHKSFPVYNKTKIKKEDLEKFEELRNIEFAIEEYKKSDHIKARKAMSELRKDQIYIRNSLSKRFDFKNVIKISNKKNDYGVINYSDKEHVKHMIQNYFDLNDKYYSDTNSDEKCLVMDFENMIHEAYAQGYLTQDEYDVVKYKMFHNLLNKEISMMVDITEKHISNMLIYHIPSKITKYYQKSREDWLYTYILKGDYKTCAKCGQNKVKSGLNFYIKKDYSKDGYNNVCIDCFKSNYYKKIGKNKRK